MNPSHPQESTRSDFVICPHCWHVNGPMTRVCVGCFADTTTMLQESGGWRLTAPVQSPVPVRVGHRLSKTQRWLLFGLLLLFGIAQLAVAFIPQRSTVPSRVPIPGAR